MKAFLGKGSLRPLLEGIPVQVITNDKAGLLGAARCAAAKSNVVRRKCFMSSLQPRYVRLATPQDLFRAAAEEVIQAATEAIGKAGGLRSRFPADRPQEALYPSLPRMPPPASPGIRFFSFGATSAMFHPKIRKQLSHGAGNSFFRKFRCRRDIFRVPTENPDASAVAADYDETLRKFFAAEPGNSPALS